MKGAREAGFPIHVSPTNGSIAVSGDIDENEWNDVMYAAQNRVDESVDFEEIQS